MKIVRLQSENVKKIRAVEIVPDPNDPLVIIRGKNGAGKTSVIDSIAMALGGKALQPPQVIRQGESEARVEIELEDLVIERRWTSNEKSYLEVRGRDGVQKKSPQALLDQLVGRLSFDPLAFSRLEPKAKADAMRKVLNVDFSELDAESQRLYDERTFHNRRAEQIRGQLAAFEGLPAKPPPGVEVKQLLDRQRELGQITSARELGATRRANAEAKVNAANEKWNRLKADRLELAERAKKLDAEIAGANAAFETAKRDERETIEALAALPDVGAELEAIRQKLGEADAANKVAERFKARDNAREELKKADAESKTRSDALKAIDKQKADALAEADFPVPGLSFGPDGVLLNELPLEQASGAEQLRVSVAVGLALNPRLKVLLVRDGSLLDADSLKLLHDLAAKAEAQVWLEVVGEGATGVLIEDGGVAEYVPPQIVLPSREITAEERRKIESAPPGVIREVLEIGQRNGGKTAAMNAIADRAINEGKTVGFVTSGGMRTEKLAGAGATVENIDSARKKKKSAAKEAAPAPSIASSTAASLGFCASCGNDAHEGPCP